MSHLPVCPSQCGVAAPKLDPEENFSFSCQQPLQGLPALIPEGRAQVPAAARAHGPAQPGRTKCLGEENEPWVNHFLLPSPGWGLAGGTRGKGAAPWRGSASPGISDDEWLAELAGKTAAPQESCESSPCLTLLPLECLPLWKNVAIPLI